MDDKLAEFRTKLIELMLEYGRPDEDKDPETPVEQTVEFLVICLQGLDFFRPDWRTHAESGGAVKNGGK